MDKYYIKPDWLTKRFDFKPRGVLQQVSGTPGIFPTSSTPDNWPTTNWCPLTKEYQFYWCSLLSLSRYGKLFHDLNKSQKAFIVKAFKGCTGSTNAFNNGKGTDKDHLYPPDEKHEDNKNRPDPKQESLICCGNFVYGTGRKVENKKGRMMVELLSLKSGQRPPVPSLTDMRVQIATIVKRNKTIKGFPQLKGPPVYFPFLTKGDAWYPLDELEKV